MSPGVVAAIVTHRRPAELRRLLDSLAASTVPLLGCVISDHAPPEARHALPPGLPFPVEILDNPSNPGPGAGWANAARHALRHFGPALTAVWYLDDDVVIPPDTLETLLAEGRDAEAVAPLLEDAAGRVWAFPEPEYPPLRPVIREVQTPAEARRRLGDAPLPFCWCTGACFLVFRPALEAGCFHREDFFILGEDLEYSMRLAARGRAVFTCRSSVPHLPPPARDPKEAARGNYLKFCSLLQNLSYLSFHAPNRGPMPKYLPGNFRRFFRTHGFGMRAMRDAAACFRAGALLGQPAGTPGGAALRDRIKTYEDWA